MFEHLVQFEPGNTDPEFVELDDAEPGEVLSAQHKTVEWLEELGVRPDDVQDKEQQTEAARKAFRLPDNKRRHLKSRWLT